jgi:hypothetical protein
MSEARREVLRANIGLGWPTYFRLGNARMLFQHDSNYHKETHANLNAALARGELFVGFLTTYPRLSINHAVLVYKRNRPLRMVELNVFLFTTPIIQNRRGSSLGSRVLVFLLIKKIGISSAGSFAFIKFTASGCSENDSVNRDHQCQIIHRRLRQLRRDRRRLLSLCRPIRRRSLRFADKELQRLLEYFGRLRSIAYMGTTGGNKNRSAGSTRAAQAPSL